MPVVSAPRAAIYTRVSTERQDRDGTSPETQEADCRAYAEARGYDVVAVLHDAASGASLERPRMAALRELLEARAVDVVLARTVDRLTRDQDDMGILYREVRAAGAVVECATQPFEDTPVGRFIVSAHAFVAETERHAIRDRTSNGRIRRAAEGRYVASRPPFGYVRVAPGTISPDPEQAVVVRLMFDLYELNHGLRAIALELNARGHRTRFGKHWAVKQVRDVLGNEAVCGVLAYGPVRVEDAFEPIITRAQFDRVQRRIARKAALPRGRTQSSENLLTGVLFCGRCKGRMVGNGKPRRPNPYGRRWYVCRRFNAGQGCERNGHAAEPLEDQVVADLNAAGTTARPVALAEAHVDRLRADLADLEAALRRLDGRRRALAEAITDRIFAGDQARQASADLEADRSTIEAALTSKRSELAAAEEAAARAAAQPTDVRRLLDPHLLPREAKAIIQTYVHRIEVFPGNPQPYILD